MIGVIAWGKRWLKACRGIRWSGYWAGGASVMPMLCLTSSTRLVRLSSDAKYQIRIQPSSTNIVMILINADTFSFALSLATRFRLAVNTR